MHGYKSFEILAIDSGKGRPHLTMTMRTGPGLETACRATKQFALEELGEVRSILAWADHAYLSAGDQLSEDGWTIIHHADCEDTKGSGHVEA